MENIEHVIYLMLENRSTDNVLGWLYNPGETTNILGATPPNYQTDAFEGLQLEAHFNPKKTGGRISVGKIKPHDGQQIPSVDPHETFDKVKIQMATTENIQMGGFYNDFSSVDGAIPEQIMQSYTPESLPILNFLAKNFAVSDAYFSSIPSQTNSNRAFSLTGNSIGYWTHFDDETGARVNNEWSPDLMPFEFTEKTIWNVISDHFGNDDNWKIFYSQLWPDLKSSGGHHYEGNYSYTQDLLWPKLKNKSANFQPIDDFYNMLDAGTLPKFSYLEPLWLGNGEKDGIKTVGHNGNSYHPPADLAPGEKFLYDLYHKLIASPKWDNTLLIINFDEHGGTYDHVLPYATATAPWDPSTNGTANPANKEEGFEFNRFGVRVPLILVSPFVGKGTVFRSDNVNKPFDHTSVIATILKWLDIPAENWNLGSRTFSTSTFENVVNLAGPRTIFPPMPEPLEPSEHGVEHPPADLHLMIVRRIFARLIKHYNYPQEKFQILYDKHFNDFSTLHEMNEKAKIIIAQMEQDVAQRNEEPVNQDKPKTKKSFWRWLLAFLKRIFKK